VQDSHRAVLQYELSSAGGGGGGGVDVCLGAVFSVMETACRDFSRVVLDYSLSQNTLDNVRTTLLLVPVRGVYAI